MKRIFNLRKFIVTITSLGFLSSCPVDAAVLPLDTGSPDITDTDELEQNDEPFINTPRAYCENDRWHIIVQPTDAETKKVWTAFYEGQGSQIMLAFIPQTQVGEYRWYSLVDGNEMDIFCDEEYWVMFVAETDYGSVRSFQRWVPSE